MAPKPFKDITDRDLFAGLMDDGGPLQGQRISTSRKISL
jgi:hypothetical protein